MNRHKVLTLWNGEQLNEQDTRILRTPCSEMPVPFDAETGHAIRKLAEAFLERDDAVGLAFYYLMVDDMGRAELTRPKISGKTFEGAVERIFLLPEGDEEDMLLNLDDDGIAEEFEPKIVRK